MFSSVLLVKIFFKEITQIKLFKVSYRLAKNVRRGKPLRVLQKMFEETLNFSKLFISTNDLILKI